MSGDGELRYRDDWEHRPGKAAPSAAEVMDFTIIDPDHPTPTVDDMIAWLLAGRCEVVDIHSYETRDGVRHSVTIRNDGRSETECDMDSLRAALEATVRGYGETLSAPCRCRCHRDAMYLQLHDDGKCGCAP